MLFYCKKFHEIGPILFIPAPASRAALTKFREDWISFGGKNIGLEITRCTAYGGKKPKALAVDLLLFVYNLQP
jgi:hypothetical protein